MTEDNKNKQSSQENEADIEVEMSPNREETTGENDIIPDTDVEGGVAFDAQKKIKELKEKIKKIEKEKQEYLEGWQRSKADFVNLRKRDEEEKKEFVKYANERLAEELIPVLDSFQMAFANKEAWEKADKNWRVGVEYIYSQLVGVLTNHGIKEVDPTGQKFDVTRDEAAEYVAVEKADDDQKILCVIQKGYILNGKLIRPAKVKVGEFKK